MGLTDDGAVGARSAGVRHRCGGGAGPGDGSGPARAGPMGGQIRWGWSVRRGVSEVEIRDKRTEYAGWRIEGMLSSLRIELVRRGLSVE